MNDGFAWWLVILGVAVGVAVVWLIMARLPRSEDDVDDEELVREAGWISRTINAYGGVAPQPLVEEVLELHRQYLDGSSLEPPAVAVDEVGAPPPARLREDGLQPRDDRALPPEHSATLAVDHAATDVDGSVARMDRAAAQLASNGHEPLGADAERERVGEQAWPAGGNGVGAAPAWSQDAASVSGGWRNPAMDAHDPGEQAPEPDVNQAR
jgi:hypothetical protein